MRTNQYQILLSCNRLSLIIVFISLIMSTSTKSYGLVRQSIYLKTMHYALQDTIGKQDTSLLHFSFQPIVIEAEFHSKNSYQERKTHQLYLDIKRIYPLARIVSNEVTMVNNQLDSVYLSKSERKNYLKWYEKHTFNNYIDTLRTLNRRQIKIFIKLIHRETGSSPFELVKKYRGGLDAFIWQFSANALLVNLKYEYDPEEDRLIEDIIRKLY